MIFDLFKQCCSHCYKFDFSDEGELVLTGNCENCVLNHERIIAFENNKYSKLNFENFKKFWNFLKKQEFNLDRTYTFEIKKNSLRIIFQYRAMKVKADNSNNKIVFLQFCLDNNIYRDYCLKELKKVLEERFKI